VNLLDAHPEIVFVRNEELFAKWQRWQKDGPEHMFRHLYESTKRYRKKPFYANGYHYPIEGVGHVDNPLVVGHKSSTRRMAELAYNPQKLTDFMCYLGMPIKVVHLTRDPYDQVMARWQQKEFRRKRAPLMPLIDHVREQLDINRRMMMHLRDMPYHQLSYEDLVDQPAYTMEQLLTFLDVEVSESHLEECCRLVQKVPHDVIPKWTDEEFEALDRLKEFYADLLEDYI
jgi:hypothetical protein